MEPMGPIRTDITLRNPRDRSLAPLTVNALVDTGALHLCIPEHLAIQLKLERLEDREVTTADGVRRLCAYVGPIECASATVAASPARSCWATKSCSGQYRWKTWTSWYRPRRGA